MKKANYPIATLFILVCLSSCLTPQKMDAYVGEQYGNQLPKQNKKLKPEIDVNSTVVSKTKGISTTVKKNKTLPLIVYWKYDYRHTCTLNPDIAVSSFSNSINSMSAKLLQKLNGRKLELTIEQVPSSFAIVDKGQIILLIHLYKLYVEPDRKDLVVSYKLLQDETTLKTGTISIKSLDHDKNIRFAQSWKSSTREYISRYNTNVTTMSKSFVTKLLEEL